MDSLKFYVFPHVSGFLIFDELTGSHFPLFSHYYGSFHMVQLEEAKLLRAQGQHQMAINLAKYILQNYQMNENTPDVFRLIGKWLAETRTSKSVVFQQRN